MLERVSIQAIRKSIAVIFIVVLVAGCGGGGGTGGGTAPVVYKGNENQARLTTANADVFVANVFENGNVADVLSLNQKSLGTGKSSVATTASGPLAVVGRLMKPGGLVLQILKPSSDPMSGNNDRRAISEKHPCPDGGEVVYSGSLSDQYLGTIRMDFRSCKSALQTFDGDITTEITAFNSTNEMFTEATLTFGAWSYRNPVSDFTISGSLAYRVNINANSETLLFNVVVRDNKSDKHYRFTDLITVNVYGNGFNSTNYSSTINGRAYDSVEGYIDIVTGNALVYSMESQDFPDSGGPMEMRGADGTWAAFIPQSASRFIIQVDTNGDALYDSYVTREW
ncbi:MAG: hypothetical protein HZA20_05130 [Nitrospirae bacterium]|nr:hypothetical protein [Nitrospirota bacterium]